MRVVVVGAGIAGLTCSAELRRAGVDVLILEARDRIGGRIWTGEVAGALVDLGAAWIHGPLDNPLAEYCREVGLAWVSDGAWGSQMQVHAPDGSLLSHVAATSLVATWTDFDPTEACSALGDEASLADAIDWYLTDRRYQGRAAEAVRFSLSWLEGGLNIGAHPDSISAHGAAAYQLHGGGNVVLVGGYQSLVEHLARDLDISLEGRVLAVEHGPDGVIVSTDARSIQADAAVITVPVGVLRQGGILFQPGLPSPIRRAIDALELSTVEKIVLRFKDHWWPDDLRRLVHITPNHAFPAWMDLSLHVGAPTLVGFFNPALATMPDDPGTRLDLALDSLTTMLGKVPKPIGAMITDWRNDPFAGGSYSYIPTGARPADMRAFTLMEGSLLFAGEHTVPEYFGTVHAAFISGRTAAARLLSA